MKLHQLRKPVKPVLYSLLFILAATATLIFSLQTLLDGLLLKNSQDQYAYVVAAYPKGNLGGNREQWVNPMLQPLSQEAMEHLESSDYVSNVHKMEVRAGKLENWATIPDYMMTMDGLAQHFFIEGTVIQDMPPAPPKPGSEPEEEDAVTLHLGRMTVRLDKQWGADFIKRGSMVINIGRMSDEKFYAPGDRVFLIGDYVIHNSAVRTDEMQLGSVRAWEYMLDHGWSDERASTLQKNAIFEIPQELAPEESEAYILEQMEQRGILDLYRAYEKLNGAVTVRYVSDMAQLPYMAKGKIYMAYGRSLVEADKGQKVCVVSQGLMLRNRLTIGDKVSLSVADGCYTIPEAYDNTGWGSGFPMEEEALLNYAPAEEYEIVGIYHQLGRDTNDPFYCSVNDVFIPEQEQPREIVSRPYTVSFRVPGDGFDVFMAETESYLGERNHALMVVDNGWEDVADSFYAMRDRLILTAICAGLCFLAAALSFGGLIFHHYRQEYGLCRLLGAYKREARKVYFGGFRLSGIPGVIVSVGVTWLVYIKWMKGKTQEAAAIVMPTDMQTLVLLLAGAAVILLVAAVFMLILIRRSERKGILRMI